MKIIKAALYKIQNIKSIIPISEVYNNTSSSFRTRVSVVPDKRPGNSFSEKVENSYLPKRIAYYFFSRARSSRSTVVALMEICNYSGLDEIGGTLFTCEFKNILQSSRMFY